MDTIRHFRSARPTTAILGLLALSLSSLLAGCDSEPAEPEGFDISLRPAEPPPTVVECVTLAPTGDAMISNPPKAQNYGGHPLLRVGGKDESLLRFDLSSIPAGSSIDGATLRLYLNGGAGTNPVNIHAATSPWTEGSVTYQSFDQDFDPAVAGVIQPDSPTALKSADVTGLVSSWFLGGQPNYGMLLETTGNQKNIFVSREGAEGYRPALEVCYVEPVLDLCAADPCQNGGTCENGPGGYTCTCPAGYEGTQCEIDIDECAGDPCVNGTCADGVAGYTCECVPGWEGNNCDVNTDDCAGEPCQNGGICTDGLSGYTCTCDAGYSGTHCETNIDDCAGDPCQNGGSCTDGVNSYSCACPAGYTGANCEIDIDECESNACQNESTCVDGVASYDCACLPGFTGPHCEEDIDECGAEPCLNGGQCLDGVNAYECACALGYTGANCEIDIDECESSPCVSGNCVDLVNGWECQCQPGFTGTHCEIDIDECESSPCINGDCTDLVNGWECACAPGYTGTNCEIEIDECESSPCVNGDCIDDVNGWECACTPGYTGTHCEIEIDECESSPCVNGDCVDLVNGWECECAPGFTGTSCEIEEPVESSCPCSGGVSWEAVLSMPPGELVDDGDYVYAHSADGYGYMAAHSTQGFCEGLDWTALDMASFETYHTSLTPAEVEACTDIIRAWAGGGEADPCADAPCQNGGTCNAAGTGYTCACPPGFAGDDCEVSCPCDPNLSEVGAMADEWACIDGTDWWGDGVIMYPYIDGSPVVDDIFGSTSPIDCASQGLQLPVNSTAELLACESRIVSFCDVWLPPE